MIKKMSSTGAGIVMLVGPPIMMAGVGAIAGLAFEYANDAFFHKQKWLIPTAGAFGGFAVGVYMKMKS